MVNIKTLSDLDECKLSLLSVVYTRLSNAINLVREGISVVVIGGTKWFDKEHSGGSSAQRST